MANVTRPPEIDARLARSPLVRYRAAWVLPIVGRPIRDGRVDVAGERIVAVGGADAAPPAGRTVDLGSAAVLPGLVNAHTHLELSWLRGQIAPAASLPAWVRALLDRRPPGRPDPEQPIAAAIEEAWRAGTILVGDISNTLASVAPLRRSRLAAVVFKELIGFRPPDPVALVRESLAAIDGLPPDERVRVSVAAHAPYSVGPALFRALRSAAAARDAPTSVHLAESVEEIEFLRAGTGPWRALLDDVGRWDPGWEPPGSGAVGYLDRLGWLDDRALVVHGVQLDDDELGVLARRGVTLVSCPRSNAWTGAGRPPLERFYGCGVRVAFGTDSLASAPDLNLFAEIAAARRLAPAVPAAALLASATLHGAQALGFSAWWGSIAPGKRGPLLAVRVPAGVGDVEEYLARGVEPADVGWLESTEGRGPTTEDRPEP